MNKVASFRELGVYKEAFVLQRELFEISRSWPREEAFSLTDQVRRSSRSIGANLAESWAKRRYPAHFLSKLTDADGEAQETLHWINVASDCGYISAAQHAGLQTRLTSIGKMLGAMMNKHETFCF